MGAYGASNTFVPGRFNVWLPQSSQSPYLSFDTAAEAQTDVAARQMGVILNPAGQLDANLQTWSGWSSYQSPVAQPIPVVLTTPANPNAAAVTPRPGSAPVIPFSTPNAPTVASQLYPKAVAGKYNVWTPPQNLSSHGVTDTFNFPQGGFQAFDSRQSALAFAQAYLSGVVLTPQGEADATQPWQPGVGLGTRFSNPRLTATPTAGQFNVWFPYQLIAQGYSRLLDIANPASFPNGAYLSFKTEAEAQAHVAARGDTGVVLDQSGAPAVTQPGLTARERAQCIAQLRNGLATPAQTPGKYSVWFPQAMMTVLGFSDLPAFPQGAFIAFDSRHEARAHCSARTMGVLVDDQSRLDAIQLWPEAQTYAAQNPAILPAPPSGWVEGPTAVDPAAAQGLGVPTAGSIALGTITPTSNGADIVAYVATVDGSDNVQFSLGAQINGNWTPIFTVPDMVKLTANGWHQFVLHVEYEAVDAYLKTISSSLGVTPDMSSAVGVTFGGGHNTGIPGWSGNSGTDQDALVSLPARI